jgi:hypothetical protein
MQKRWAVALVLALGLALGSAGCSQADAEKTASTIHAYLPTVVSLANEAATVAAALDPSDAAEIQSVSAKVQKDLTELELISGTYASAPSSSVWTQLTAVVDQLVSDADSGLLAAANIKDASSQAKAKIALSALDAAVHVVDGYLQAAQPPATVQKTAAARNVKLHEVTQYWNSADWQRVNDRFGGHAQELAEDETRIGF